MSCAGAAGVVRGREQALYGTVAPVLMTDPSQTSSAYLDAYRRSAAALLRLAERQVVAALERQEADGARRPLSLRVHNLQARLSPSAQRELARKLDEVMRFLAERDDPDAREHVAVTVVSAPVEPKG